MAGSLWSDRRRITIGLVATVFMLLYPDALWQIAAIVAGGVVGLVLLRGNSAASEDSAAADAPSSTSPANSRKLALGLITLFFVLLAGLPVLAEVTGRSDIDVFENFYRSGSLVFGGGHVVLPLLQSETVDTGRVTSDEFLAGYGATQAVPGPLFTFAAFLGSSINGVFSARWVGGLVTLAAIYIPSFLLVWGALPFWIRLRGSNRIGGVVAGINAVVVGLLLSALYNPIWKNGVVSAEDFGLVIVLFGMLAVWKLPPWLVVVAAVGGGYVLDWI
jgi:chromate transporter